jgi:predicted DNA-binding protein
LVESSHQKTNKMAGRQETLNTMAHKKLELDDLLNDLLANLENGNSDVLKQFAEDYPEYREDLYRAVGIANTLDRIPEQTYSNDEDEVLTLRAASVVQNLLHELRSRSTQPFTSEEEVKKEIPFSSLIQAINDSGETLNTFAEKSQLSTVLLRIFNNREVNPNSIPTELFKRLSNLLGTTFDSIYAYLASPPQLASESYKAEKAPEFSARLEFDELIKKDPDMSNEIKEYWLGLKEFGRQ